MTIKDTIKELSAEQTQLRKQRKESYQGTRIQGSHFHNRIQLRHLFHVYAKLRGKEIPLPKKPGKELSDFLLAKLEDKYKIPIKEPIIELAE